MDELIDSSYLPLLILVAGFIDVALGTSRFLMVTAGYRWQAATLATLQTTVFVMAVGIVAANLDDPLNVVGYAMGWGSGTWVSMWVESRVGLGFRQVQMINHDPTVQLVPRLRELGHRVTQLRASGRSGDVEVAVLVIRRRALDPILSLVHELAPESFITVERVDRTAGGAFAEGPHSRRWPWGR
jgi:uncharacterized protein YebE (UPF0316 family)